MTSRGRLWPWLSIASAFACGARSGLEIGPGSAILGTSIDGGSDGAGMGTGGAPSPRVLELTAGGAHTCALLSDGSVKCWGSNLFGELGTGEMAGPSPCVGGPCATTPSLVSGVNGAVAIAAGERHTCALLAGGTVQCWGSDFDGELGNGVATMSVPAPVYVSNLIGVSSITAGAGHTCARLSNGSAACWGSNVEGELGNGTISYYTGTTSPAPVPGLGAVTAISAGSGDTCALLTTGIVECWGDNASGQLGNGTSVGVGVATPVSNLTDAVTVVAGDDRSCALRRGGRVSCWGANQVGQLGDGTQIASPFPVPVSRLTDAVALALGGERTCALLSSGEVDCWGTNTNYELGNATTNELSSTPLPVPGVTAVAIAVGEAHACFLRPEGSVACWGLNSSGELGDGTAATDRATARSGTPVDVVGL